nr:hypothetical protein CFP56_74434 [Quercus suber]
MLSHLLDRKWYGIRKLFGLTNHAKSEAPPALWYSSFVLDWVMHWGVPKRGTGLGARAVDKVQQVMDD